MQLFEGKRPFFHLLFPISHFPILLSSFLVLPVPRHQTLSAWELVKPGMRKEELGNGKREMGNDGNRKQEIKTNLHARQALCIQQYFLERTSATGDSTEEVETIA